VASKLIQQLLNVLQAANVEAVRASAGSEDCKRLVSSLFFANGATGDAGPRLCPPVIDVSEYLVKYTSPGGETAYLTMAQAQVISESWDLERLMPDTHHPLGCCTDSSGKGTPNKTKNDCPCPPNQSWCQGPCGG
jgi:hypothetical protein